MHHKRAILMAVATMSLLGTNAMADNFTFSFNTGANTVTGEIFGLNNNGTAAPATEVLITSYPPIFGTIPDLVATNWTTQLHNSFTETGGDVTAAAFLAEESSPAVELDFSLAQGLLEKGDHQLQGAITFTPAPVPEPFAWILLATVMLAIAIVKRSRRTDGLNDTATRMRS
jgi:hypothetical protein